MYIYNVYNVYKNTQRLIQRKMDEVGTQWDEGIREDGGVRKKGDIAETECFGFFSIRACG